MAEAAETLGPVLFKRQSSADLGWTFVHRSPIAQAKLSVPEINKSGPFVTKKIPIDLRILGQPGS
jgi:hypothetical protein